MSSSDPGRRSFLRGDFSEVTHHAMRPPRAVTDFESLCASCGDCVANCPEGIIVLDGDKRPVVDLNRGACTFCGACAEVCPSGALDPALEVAWSWRAQVDAACLSQRGIACRSCEDACDFGAIRFQLALGGRSSPRIDLDQCTGCGACANACPVRAVTFVRQNHTATGRLE